MTFSNLLRTFCIGAVCLFCGVTVEAQSLYVIGNLAVSNGLWNPSSGVELAFNGTTYSGVVDFQPYGSDSHSYFAVVANLTASSDDWSARRYGADSNDMDVTIDKAMTLNDNSNSWKVLGGRYRVSVDLEECTLTVSTQTAEEYPADLFVVGNLAVSGGSWDVRRAVCLVREGSVYSGTVEFQGYNGEATSYFTLVSKLGYYGGDDWATVGTSPRYGAASNNAQASPSATVVKNSTESWRIASGTYKITVDLSAGTLTVGEPDAAHGAGMIGGWPDDYDGVMLQSFYWDCFNDGWGWNWLSARADDISSHFDVMWIPNFANCDASGAGGMGYHPINWFTNFASAFGTEQQFRDMMAMYRDKGMDMMAEVVINHRFAFPTETWNGKSWHIGNDGIPNNDSPTPGSGNADTGGDWGLCADLDHTNANVRANIKAYEDMLVGDLGFSGFRYDYVIGYAPEFIKIYNRHCSPSFSVGEYWDEDRGKVAAWINGTAYQSAAFDFPGKFAISAAFRDNDMTKLVDATLADYGYGRYAVTFIDNHDTYNEDANRFAGADDQIVAANAFILSMPGTPCVFIVHWNRFADELKPLIDARKKAGVTNSSPVTLLRSNARCYMAEVRGNKGKLVVKVGPEMVSPDGYSDSDIVTSGNQYCVWRKMYSSDPDIENPAVEVPEHLYLVGNLVGADWNTSSAPELECHGNVFRTSQPVKFSGNPAYFSFITARGSSWDDVNQNARISPSLESDAAISLDSPATFNVYAPPAEVHNSKAWTFANPLGASAEYNLAVDFGKKQVTVSHTNDLTAIESITVDAADATYYNLMGCPVDNPGPGIYIRVINGRPAKVIVK